MSDEHTPRLIQDGHKSKIQVTDEALQRLLSPLTGGTVPSLSPWKAISGTGRARGPISR